MEPAAAPGSILADMSTDKVNNNDAWIRKALITGTKIHQAGYRNALAKKGVGDTSLLTSASKAPVATPKQSTLKADQTVLIKVVKDVMKFDKEVFTVKAGTIVHIILQNPDFMQHNLVIIKPKTLEKVGAAADKLAMDPNGAKLNYVPKMPEVLFATPLINPEGKYTLKFKVPMTAGSYPYICTFPGHWRIMKGVMKVIN